MRIPVNGFVHDTKIEPKIFPSRLNLPVDLLKDLCQKKRKKKAYTKEERMGGRGITRGEREREEKKPTKGCYRFKGSGESLLS